MIKQFLLLLLLGAGLHTFAQKDKKSLPEGSANEKQYYDLLMYYMDGDYEKCIKKSEKLTEDDETSKDAMPYLYASMSYFELAFIEEYKEKYPEAFKDALRLAVRYRKKDEKNSLKQGLPQLEFWEANKPYIEKLRKSAKEIAENHIIEGKAAKAEYYYKQLVLLDPADYSVWFMMGQMRFKAGDKAGADKNFQEFENLVKNISNFSTQPEDMVDLLKYAYFDHVSTLLQQGQAETAKAAIDRLAGILGKDKDVENYRKEKNL